MSEATPVTSGNQAIEGMGVSPDGRFLVFDSNRSGNQDIYKMPLGPLETGELVQLTTDSADDFDPAFSPDGKEIVFYSLRTGNRDIFIMSSEGGTARRLTRSAGQDNLCPDWSPDGKNIAFESDRSGRSEVYVISADRGEPETGTPLPLTTEGGNFPKWSRDGRSIAYSHNGLSIVNADSGESRVLVPTAEFANAIDLDAFPENLNSAWSLDGRVIYYLVYDRENSASIGSVATSGGGPTLLVRFDDPARVSIRIEWAAGAGRFYFTLTEHESDIWVMDLEPKSF